MRQRRGGENRQKALYCWRKLNMTDGKNYRAQPNQVIAKGNER